MHHTWRVFFLLVNIQLSPAVLRLNIAMNPATLRVSLGFPHWLGDSPRCSQTSHNRSHGAPVPVLRDPSYSDGRPQCPPRVWFSPEIDASKFTLRLLSDTPGGSQWLKYILLMQFLSLLLLVTSILVSSVRIVHGSPVPWLSESSRMITTLFCGHYPYCYNDFRRMILYLVHSVSGGWQVLSNLRRY